MPQGLLRAQKFLPGCGVAPGLRPTRGGRGPGGCPGRRQVSRPALRASALLSRPCAGPGSGAAPSWGPRGNWAGGVRALGAGGSPQFLVSAATPASRRTRALFRALMAPKRVPASPPPRCPKLSFPSFSPFQTPSPILSGFVGLFHPTSLHNRRLGRPGLIPPERHCLGDLGVRGPPVAQPHPPQTHFSASRPSPLRPPAPVGARNSPDFPLPFYLFLFGKQRKESRRGVSSPERGRIVQAPPRQLPAPRLRSLGPIFGPRTMGLQARGRAWGPARHGGHPDTPGAASFPATPAPRAPGLGLSCNEIRSKPPERGAGLGRASPGLGMGSTSQKASRGDRAGPRRSPRRPAWAGTPGLGLPSAAQRAPAAAACLRPLPRF